MKKIVSQKKIDNNHKGCRQGDKCALIDQWDESYENIILRGFKNHPKYGKNERCSKCNEIMDQYWVSSSIECFKWMHGYSNLYEICHKCKTFDCIIRHMS